MTKRSLKINDKPAKNLIEALSAGFVTKIGVLGKKSARKKGDMSNADIGLVHEKGSLSQKIPRRSFLEMPLTDKHKEIFLKKKKFYNEVIKKILSGQSPKSAWKEAYKKLGILGESIVQESFETHGFGKWQELKPATIARKKSESPLIDTAQLRKSITSKVDKK